MSYNKTYSEIKQILKDSKRISKATMLKIAKLAILETLGEERSADVEVKWDSKLGDDLMLDSLDMVELVMFLEECFGAEIPDEMAYEIVTVGDAIEVIKKAKAQKGKKRKKVNLAEKYKNKSKVSVAEGSPFAMKKPLSGLNPTLPSNADIEKALDEANDEDNSEDN
jgi:acyl carrier protein|tara:strand:- start:2265 stop:2765 length:501 start_codon:yes stop_codon:yes gene_type:complete